MYNNNFFNIKSQKIKNILSILLFSLILIGCGEDDKKTKKGFYKQQTQKYSKETTLKGKISNTNGAINGGQIIVTDLKGKKIAETMIQTDKNYSVKIPSGTELPIVLTFTPDSKSTAKDELISVVIYTSIKKYDVNELTTLIAKNAKALGGYTHANMVMAADSTVGIPDANKTSTGFRGDPTKQYGGWH